MNIQRCGLVSFGEKVKHVNVSETTGSLVGGNKNDVVIKQDDVAIFSTDNDMWFPSGYRAAEVSFMEELPENKGLKLVYKAPDGMKRSLVLGRDDEIFSIDSFDKYIEKHTSELKKTSSDAKELAKKSK